MLWVSGHGGSWDGETCKVEGGVLGTVYLYTLLYILLYTMPYLSPYLARGLYSAPLFSIPPSTLSANILFL